MQQRSSIAHDPALRPCAALIGADPDAQWGISQCTLIFWDPTVRLPPTFQDCKERFIDEPAVIRPRGQDVCFVFVGILDEALFEQCRKMPYAEYREGFCRYPLAGPDWSPPLRAGFAGASDQAGGAHF